MDNGRLAADKPVHDSHQTGHCESAGIPSPQLVTYTQTIHQHLTMDSILPTVSLVHCLTPQATLDAFVRHYNHLQTTDHATG